MKRRISLMDSLVSYRILSEGNEINDSYQVVTIVVQNEINRIPYTQIDFQVLDSIKGKTSISDADTFVPVNEIEIQAGYHDETETIFKGIVSDQQMKSSKGALFLIVNPKLVNCTPR